ncbi:MAG: tRNA (N6-threonylcarbamoyladenosine(37)-N6)-methyltransferase TrmO [Chlorobi bacterium]|nr:tRNA (N6-threonylcarbamoyladenosine(37)-N6)-methyltransferase TrmO [Chlorobiota bacterium]
MNKSFVYHPIGVIRSPYKVPKGTPIQSSASKGAKGVIEIFPEYQDGLKDLDGFSHIILVYHFHLAGKSNLRIKPFLDENFHGLFATRAPARPNPIGLSIVRLLHIEGNRLVIRDVDMIEGTPLLDIKPYVPEFDHREADKTGWLASNIHKLPGKKDDGHFSG